MKHLLAALALLFSCHTLAADLSVTFDEGVTITLSDTPCDNKAVVALLIPDRRKHYQNGHGVFPAGVLAKEAVTVRFCWRVSPQDPGTLWVIDERGASGPLPMAAFAPKPTGTGI